MAAHAVIPSTWETGSRKLDLHSKTLSYTRKPLKNLHEGYLVSGLG